MSVVPYGLLRAQGIGVRHVHATGNDADVTVSELASVVAEDPDLRLLLLYLETIRDPWNLAETARIAHARGLPVIALKSGRTPAGQQAAKSHTGALANEDRVVDAFLEKHGIWRARDVGELTRAAELYLKGWKPKGRRLVAISNSGAICVMAADAADQPGHADGAARPGNPRRAGEDPAQLRHHHQPDRHHRGAAEQQRAVRADPARCIAKDPAADAFLIGIPVAGQGYDVDGFAADSAVFARRTGKPLVTAIPQPNIAAKFKAQGLPVFATESEAVAALNQYLSHMQMLARLSLRRRPPRARAAPPRAQPTRTLNEADSLALLARHGVPVMRHRLCRSPEEAVAALHGDRRTGRGQGLFLGRGAQVRVGTGQARCAQRGGRCARSTATSTGPCAWPARPSTASSSPRWCAAGAS